MRGTVPAFSVAVWAHIAGGVVILALVVWRLALRLGRGVPAPSDSGPAILHRLAGVGHWVLYALMVLIPVSGLVAWFASVGTAADAHEVMTTVLLIVVGLHVLAALFHQFWLKDRLLLRIMRAER